MLDVTQILLSIWSQIWFLIPLAFLIGLVRSAWFKGIMGELLVRIMLWLFLDGKRYTVINNVTLPTEDGTTQIDHIVVSPYGVFVIETKNMKGWIFGSPNQKSWTQKIYRQSYKFQNPLHQNYKHTRTLADCLSLDEVLIKSVIVFVGDSTFKTDMPDNVTYAGGVIRFIKRFNDVLLTERQVNQLVVNIQFDRLKPSFKTDRAHVRHLKQKHEPGAESKSTQVYCPKCSSVMVKRVAKSGDNTGKAFLGCSNFPKCRSIINL